MWARTPGARQRERACVGIRARWPAGASRRHRRGFQLRVARCSPLDGAPSRARGGARAGARRRGSANAGVSARSRIRGRSHGEPCDGDNASRARRARRRTRLGAMRNRSAVGRPAEQLHVVAEEHEADLLVIGRTGKRARGVKQLGSTVERLLRRSAKPVRWWRPARSLRHLAAYSPPSTKERSRAMCSSGRGEWRDEPDPRAPVQSPRCTSRANALSKYLGARGGDAAAVAWLRARVSECSLDATTEIAVAPGDPRHQILVAADAFESDLIVVGRRGVDGGAGTEIGGVARAALRPTTRAVLVIPSGSRGAPGDAHRDATSPRVRDVVTSLSRSPPELEPAHLSAGTEGRFRRGATSHHS